jgi:23S rRNA pseudouridine2605 synthase
MERWIQSGCVQVNGQTAELGASVSADDKISVKGRIIVNPLKLESKTRVLLYHKPLGEISSRSDPMHKKTVFDHLPHLKQGRWVQVGRLDMNTSGLLIFTNNGELANHLMHPKYQVEREYAVRVHGQVPPDAIKNLLTGVKLEDGVAKFKHATFEGGEGTNSWYHVVLTEGRNREVRRLWKSQGLEVSRLIRIRYGDIRMPRSLARGQYVELSPQDVTALISSLK